jgi:hypothetical protein
MAAYEVARKAAVSFFEADSYAAVEGGIAYGTMNDLLA